MKKIMFAIMVLVGVLYACKGTNAATSTATETKETKTEISKSSVTLPAENATKTVQQINQNNINNPSRVTTIDKSKLQSMPMDKKTPSGE